MDLWGAGGGGGVTWVASPESRVPNLALTNLGVGGTWGMTESGCWESIWGFPNKENQGCGIKGFLPTSVIQGNPPLYEENSRWEALSVVSQKWSFPTEALETDGFLRDVLAESNHS